MIEKIKRQAVTNFGKVIESLNKKTLCDEVIDAKCKWGGLAFEAVNKEVDYSIKNVQVHKVIVAEQKPKSLRSFFRKPKRDIVQYFVKLDVSMSVYYMTDGHECLSPGFFAEELCIKPGEEREIKRGIMTMVYSQEGKIISVDELGDTFILFG